MKTFKSFKPLSDQQEFRRVNDRFARCCQSPADVLTALRGVEVWRKALPFFARRVPFAWKPGQLEWVTSELEKYDAEQRLAEEAKTLVEFRCTVCPARWKGNRSVPANCPECQAKGELALDDAEEPTPEPPKGIVLA